ELREAILGRTHRDTLAAKATLAFLVAGPGAEGLLPDGVPLYEGKLPVDDEATLWAQLALAWAYQRQGKYERSKELFTELITKYEKKYGVQSVASLGPLLSLGVQYLHQHREKDAEDLFKKILFSPLGKEDWVNLTDGRATAHTLAEMYVN